MQIALNRRLAFMAGQRDSRLIHAHSKSRCHNRLRFGRPFSFQGEFRWLSDPGLKPISAKIRMAGGPPKGENRIAQALEPWVRFPSELALKGRPDQLITS
jgi:hypothetical protein